MPAHPTPTPARRQRLLAERMLAIVPAPEKGADVFTSTTESPFQPIWARGTYGGFFVAQSLMAAHATAPAGFLAHSIHCHFLVGGRNDASTDYRVERVRDGRSFATRIVKAEQLGRLIFTAVVSLALQPAGGSSNSNSTNTKRVLAHQRAMPPTPQPPTRPGKAVDRALLTQTGQADWGSTLEVVRIPMAVDGTTRPSPESLRLQHWYRACADTTPELTPQAPGLRHANHLEILAYLSDHYFIGTVARVHAAELFNNSPGLAAIKRSADASTAKGRKKLQAIRQLEAEENSENTRLEAASTDRPHVGMMVSLDHTIYFHDPAAVHADEWMLVENQTPWAGQDRTLLIQRVWAQNGTLLATSVQEGAVRLQQDSSQSRL